MMRIVADSGSTKTAWWVGDENARSAGDGRVLKTLGINPFQMSSEEMVSAMMPAREQVENVVAIDFYGAGCTREKAPEVAAALHKVFGERACVSVNSDLLGAAHAVCGSEEGIVCILGTGSNSCWYDGCVIRENVSPLGFILGDEGSGAYIGRRLVGNCLKRQFSKALCDLFLKETNLTAAEIVQRTYRQPQPNRFLASLTPFCFRHHDRDEMRRFLIDCFSEFFLRNVALYGRKDLAVHFVGSIAWQYEDELSAAAGQCGFRLGRILKEPLDAMVNYVLCK